MHLVGYYRPIPLWGVDLFHYYPTTYVALFILASVAVLGLAATRHRRHAAIAARRVGRWIEKSAWTRRGFLACFAVLAYVGRVREHSLGDSILRFSEIERPYDRYVEESSIRAALADILSNSSVHFELFDVLIHFCALLIGRQMGEWTPQDVYAWLSITAGLIYLGAIWRLSCLLGETTLQRTTYFSLSATLGSVQLYFGYGESYTLVSACAAVYAVQVLHALRGGSFLYPTLCWLLCVSLHAMALSLLPSLLYILWLHADRPGRTQLSNRWLPFVLWPLVFIVATSLYALFYPIRMPLWTPDETVTYALFSLGHARLLLNAALMVSPFGLAWGMASYFSNRFGQREDAFLSWAAWGALGLMFYHNAYLGGRDWDLLSFPGLFCTLWGLRALLRCMTGYRLCTLSMLWAAVVPLMCLHTSAFIGINTDSQRVHARLQNLMQDSNQSQHYRYFSIGYYYFLLEREKQAVQYFRMANAEAPKRYNDEQALAIRWYTYESFLGRALALAQQYEEAKNVLENASSSWNMNYNNTLLTLVRVTAEVAFQRLEDGDYQSVKDLLRRALDHSSLLDMRRLDDEGKKNQETLINVLTKTKEALEKNNVLNTYIYLGQALYAVDGLKSAEKAFEKAANILLEMGHSMSAINVLEKGTGLLNSASLRSKLQQLKERNE